MTQRLRMLLVQMLLVAERINVGGQAVLEGVMMRAPRSMAIAVRRPGGDIAVKREEVPPLSERYPVVKLPVLRGAVALFTSLSMGLKALNFSANEAIAEEEGEKEEISSWALGGTMAASASCSFSCCPSISPSFWCRSSARPISFSTWWTVSSGLWCFSSISSPSPA
ncbi:MAG TPA: DUF1385 domain-containing protein [Geobacter anodireducens]|nr:DUF1385 domain-containing protein [Geobacter anodireducens]